MSAVEQPVKRHHILLAEDNEDDYILTRDAFQEAGLPVDLEWVQDGEALMNRLKTVTPELILLDLNMPKKNGRESLKEIRADARLRRIPVIIFSTSGAPSDVQATFELGASAYVQKPIGFDQFIRAMKALYEFWFGVAKIPSVGGPHGS